MHTAVNCRQLGKEFRERRESQWDRRTQKENRIHAPDYGPKGS